jgi:hypothetical protein
MSINGWSATEYTRITRTAILRAWKAPGTPLWQAEVKNPDGEQLATGGTFVNPGDAMDWADDRWRELIP